MMVVILVMGLLVALVLTRGPERSPTLSLRLAASDLAQSLRLARTEAIVEDRAVLFIADPASQSYGTAGAVKTLPAGISLAVIANNESGIVFEPDGSALPGIIWLRTGSLRQSVAVNWLTGQVSLSQVAMDDQN